MNTFISSSRILLTSSALCPNTTAILSGFNFFAVFTTQEIMGLFKSLCKTFGILDFILFPLPAANMRILSIESPQPVSFTNKP